MKPFQKMLQAITSSPYHDRMTHFMSPLRDHLGVNHFWHYRITYSGYYSFIGTHSAWSEYCFDVDNISHFPCLRHPDRLKSGLNLMKRSSTDCYRNVLEDAWKKFSINFNFQFLNKTAEGIEAYGFATQYNDPQVDEILLNEVNVLQYFIKQFKKHNKQLLDIVYDHQVNLASHMGSTFYQEPISFHLPFERQLFLKKIGSKEAVDSFTKREKELLFFLSKGYPASHIADQLALSVRTVQNYIESIKDKLYCQSKVELIQKAQDLVLLWGSSFSLLK